MKKKRVLFGVLGVVVLLVAGGWLWLRSSAPSKSGETPQGALTNMDKLKAKGAKLAMQTVSTSITGIRGDNIQVQSKVMIKNPLPVAIGLTGLDYAVQINGVKAAEGKYPNAIRLPASGSQTITLPMTLSAKAVDAVNDKLEQQGKDTALYTFINTVHTDVPIAGEQSFTVTIDEALPIVWLPRLKPGDLDIKKFTLDSAGIRMTMQVTNPNSFTIRMKDGRYSMIVDGDKEVNGTMQETVVLPAKGTVPVSMYMAMKTGSALKMGWKALFDKKDTQYKLKFDGQILSDQKMLQNATVHFTDEGTLDKLMKAVANQ